LLVTDSVIGSAKIFQTKEELRNTRTRGFCSDERLHKNGVHEINQIEANHRQTKLKSFSPGELFFYSVFFGFAFLFKLTRC